MNKYLQIVFVGNDREYLGKLRDPNVLTQILGPYSIIPIDNVCLLLQCPDVTLTNSNVVLVTLMMSDLLTAAQRLQELGIGQRAIFLYPPLAQAVAERLAQTCGGTTLSIKADVRELVEKIKSLIGQNSDSQTRGDDNG